MIEISDLEIKHSDIHLMKVENLIIKEKGLYLITGANGIGKTSFLRSLAEHINTCDKNKYSNKVSFMSAMAEYNNQIPLSGHDYLSLYIDKSQFEVIKKHSVLSALLIKKISHLSAGEFQSLTLAAQIYSNSKVLLLDEPFSHLSSHWIHIFISELIALAHSKLIIIVSHQSIDELSKASEVFEIIDKKLIKRENLK